MTRGFVPRVFCGLYCIGSVQEIGLPDLIFDLGQGGVIKGE